MLELYAKPKAQLSVSNIILKNNTKHARICQQSFGNKHLKYLRAKNKYGCAQPHNIFEKDLKKIPSNFY